MPGSSPRDPLPALDPVLAGVPGPSGLPPPGRALGTGRAPRLPPGAEGLPPGGGGQAPGVALRGGAAAPAGRSAAGPRRLRETGRPARREGRDGGALRWARPLPINRRALFFFFFFLPVFVSFPLPLTSPSLLPGKLNKRWKLCVCLCRGEDVISNYFSGNQSLAPDPPSSRRALRERGCRRRSPLPERDPRGLFAPGGAQPRGARARLPGPGRPWPAAAAAP